MTVIVNSGRLKWPITFQKKKRIDDLAGSWSEEWEDFANDRVRIVPIGAAERIRSDREEVVITHLFEGRYRADINDSMRVNHNGRTLEIKHIINVEEADVINHYLCTEVKKIG